MSDTILPPLPSSSSLDESRVGKSRSSSSSGNDIFPFLVHSQASVTNGERPEVDNGKLARQKRRRTSPEDQAFLEAEYKRNPKPDKAARVEIVKHVALGEKEVQIWFQNRRQTTRRKSRPLLPHEIAAFGLGGMAALSSASDQEHHALDLASHRDIASSGERGYNRNAENCLNRSNARHSSSVGELEPTVLIQDLTKPSMTATNPFKSSKSLPLGVENSSYLPYSLSESSPSGVGYLSNLRIGPHASATVPVSSQTQSTSTMQDSSSQSESIPKSSADPDVTALSSSQIRLSLSLDGKAELIPADKSPQKPSFTEASSSATKVPQRRASGLQRSQSALPFGPLPKKTSSAVPFAPRMPSGRSRDARTWEFCCDIEARDELTTQAENESSGSAVAAISLLRSTSNSMLKSNMSKRNAPVPKTEAKHGKRPKLARATSSLGRLQSSSLDLATELPSKEIASGSKSPGDSDKENWLPPDSAASIQPRRPLPSVPQPVNRRRVLGDATGAKARNFVGQGGQKAKHEPKIFEDNENEEVNDEIERFMRGEISPSKKGDFDCIQGLLSLSQGNWR